MKVDWISRTVKGKKMWMASCSCVVDDEQWHFSDFYDNRSHETEQAFLIMATRAFDFAKRNK
jgi:hypothetical protein